jgi:hypothetical protein
LNGLIRELGGLVDFHPLMTDSRWFSLVGSSSRTHRRVYEETRRTGSALMNRA